MVHWPLTHMKTANTVFNISLPSLEARMIPLSRVWGAKNGPSCDTLINVRHRNLQDFPVDVPDYKKT
jgi:hypothetical protein